MDMGDLRTFLVVVEEAHFGRAAKRLNISLPQVSQRIRRLEKHLKVELLARTTRSVSVTPIGQELVVEGKKIIARINWVEQYMQRLASGQEGVLRVGAISSVSYTVLPQIAQVIEAEMPEVTIRVSGGLFTPAQEQALEERSVDVGIVRLPLRRPGILYRVVASDPLVLVLSANHALADCSNLRIEDLQEEAFVTYPQASGSVVREAVLRACEKGGFTPRSIVEVSDTSTLIGLVASGIGVALVPRSSENLRSVGVKFVDLDLREDIEIALAWRKEDHSPMLRKLLDVLEKAGLFMGPTKQTKEES